MSNKIFYFKIQGYPQNFTTEQVRNDIEAIAEEVIEVSKSRDNNFLVAVHFTGTKEKFRQEVQQHVYGNGPLSADDASEFPIMKNLPRAPMLYEDESNKFPFFPLEDTKNENQKIQENFDSRPSTRNKTDTQNYKMPAVSGSNSSPWSSTKH